MMLASAPLQTNPQCLRFDGGCAFCVQAIPAYAVILMMLAFIAGTVVLTEFTYAPYELNAPALSLLFCAAMGILLRGFRMALFGSVLEWIALFGSISLAAPLCAAISASTNLPLVDDELLAMDKAIFFGFDRSDLAHWVVARETLFGAIRVVYNSLTFQPAVLLFMLMTQRQEERAWRLLCAWGLSLTVSILVFMCLPARGSPPVFLDYLDVLTGARDGSLRLVGLDMLTGIITFPSFHAAAAVMLGWGFSRVRVIGPAMVVWNVFMFLSAAVASHYLVDLIAGGFIASAAIWAANRIMGRIEKGAGTPRCLLQPPIIPANSSAMAA